MPLDGIQKQVSEEVFDFSNRNLYNPVYIPTLYKRDPFLHYFGGAGSGKSVFVAQKHIVYSFQPWRRGRKTIVARRFYNSLGNSCYAELKNVIYGWGVDDCFKFGRSPYYIRNIKTDVEFIFVGLDDVEKIKSIRGVDKGWLEEATEVRQKDDLDQLGTRLRGFKFVQWDLTYNPVDAEHWLNKEIHIPRLPGHYILKTTVDDNLKLLEIDPGYVNRLEVYKHTNPNHYRVYKQGVWGKRLEGLIYPDYNEVSEMPCRPQAYGLDFGYNEPTALCKIAIVDEPGKDKKQLYVEEVFYELKHTSDSLVAKLATAKVSKNIPIIADSARPEMIASLRSAGYWVEESWKAHGSVKAGIDNVKTFDLRPVGGGKNLFAELNGHSWKNKNGVWLDEPQAGLDHLCDGFRYATWYLAKPSSSGMEEYEHWV